MDRTLSFLSGLLCAAAAWATFSGAAEGVLGLLLGSAALLGGAAAVGPLLLVTPVEPSPLKLGCLAAALGPVWVTVASAAGAGLGLGGREAVAAALALSAALALLGSLRRLHLQPLGAAAWLSLAVGLVCGALILLTGLSEVGDLLVLDSSSHVTQAALAERLMGHPMDPVQPFFAGGALELRPGLAAVIAVLSLATGVSTTIAQTLLCAWAAALLVPLAYLTVSGAAGGLEGRGGGLAGLRDVAGMLVGAGGWLLFGVFVLGPRSDAGLGLVAVLASAALFTGLHAARARTRPWPQLTLACTAALAIIAPAVGAALAAGGAVAAVLGRRWTLAALYPAALIPALWIGRTFGGLSMDPVERAGQVGSLGRLPELQVPALGIALLALVILGFRGGEALARPRRGLVFLALCTLAASGLGLLWPDTWGDVEVLGGAAVMCAAPLLATGAWALPGRVLGAGATGLVGLGGAACFALHGYGTFAFLESERGALPVPLTRPLLGAPELIQDPPLAAGLGDAFRWIRERRDFADDPQTVLVRPNFRRGSLSLAPMLTGLPLWWDGEPPPGAYQDRRLSGRLLPIDGTDLGDSWAARRDLMEALFRTRDGWEPRFQRLLTSAQERGTRFVVVVTEQDRRRTTDRGSGRRGADMPWQRLGLEPAFETDEVTVWAPPAPDR